MIQFALLYGLGFLSAALLAMLLAPAIHQRIVHFTETRLKATMPLSPQEIRAQKDLARAAYAAENARTMQDLIREREKSVDLQKQTDALSREVGRLAGDGEVLRGRVEEMEVEASRLRAEALRHQNEVVTFAEAVRRQEDLSAGKDLEIEQLAEQAHALGSAIDDLKIENGTLGMEVENLKSRLQGLRDEREELRRDARLTTQRAKDAEQRLIQEEHTRLRLDDRLGRQMAESADKDQLLERRMREIGQLKERLRRATTEARAAHRAIEDAKPQAPGPQIAEVAAGPDIASTAATAQAAEEPLPPSIPASTAADRQKLADELHHRQTALTELLLKATTSSNDDALRNEVADIAAGMIVLSAMQDGRGSAVDDILSTKTTRRDSGKRITLAERARKRKIDIDKAHGSSSNA